jgi:hypothetical protein
VAAMAKHPAGTVALDKAQADTPRAESRQAAQDLEILARVRRVLDTAPVQVRAERVQAGTDRAELVQAELLHRVDPIRALSLTDPPARA